MVHEHIAHTYTHRHTHSRIFLSSIQFRKRKRTHWLASFDLARSYIQFQFYAEPNHHTHDHYKKQKKRKIKWTQIFSCAQLICRYNYFRLLSVWVDWMFEQFFGSRFVSFVIIFLSVILLLLFKCKRHDKMSEIKQARKKITHTQHNNLSIHMAYILLSLFNAATRYLFPLTVYTYLYIHFKLYIVYVSFSLRVCVCACIIPARTFKFEKQCACAVAVFSVQASTTAATQRQQFISHIYMYIEKTYRFVHVINEQSIYRSLTWKNSVFFVHTLFRAWLQYAHRTHTHTIQIRARILYSFAPAHSFILFTCSLRPSAHSFARFVCSVTHTHTHTLSFTKTGTKQKKILPHLCWSFFVT